MKFHFKDCLKHFINVQVIVHSLKKMAIQPSLLKYLLICFLIDLD